MKHVAPSGVKHVAPSGVKHVIMGFFVTVGVSSPPNDPQVLVSWSLRPHWMTRFAHPALGTCPAVVCPLRVPFAIAVCGVSIDHPYWASEVRQPRVKHVAPLGVKHVAPLGVKHVAPLGG